jgi:adenine-specific DNA-methyltransferase
LTDERMPLTSQSVLADRVAAMRELFPEVFTEDKVDFQRLRRELGEHVEDGRERYGLSWAGKGEAIRNVQSQSIGALRPAPEEWVDFESTENLFIEGDNLEVLKLLQKSYHGRVKMIYIDPPYNTGNEFIYPDNFREGIDDYLRFSGQKNGDGAKLSTNTETGGPLPLQMARHDVPAPLPRPQPAARGRRDSCAY